MTNTYASGETPQIGDTVELVDWLRGVYTQSRSFNDGTYRDVVEALDTFGFPILVGDDSKGAGRNASDFRLVSRADTKPQIDVSAIKPGDFVTVRLEVMAAAADRPDILLIRRACGPAAFVETAAVVGHEPKAPEPLKVGDRVRAKAGETVREILAIDGDLAWTKSVNSTGYFSLLLANLERVS